MRNVRGTLIILVSMFAIGFVVWWTWLYPDWYVQVKILLSEQSLHQLDDYLRSWGVIGPLISIGLMVLQSIIAPLPSFVIAAANGMVYGLFWGSVISWIGGIAGAITSFLLARKLGYRLIHRVTSNAGFLKRVDDIGDKDGFTMILIARLLPIVSFDAISLLAGLSGIRMRTFLIATGIGQIPGTILYVVLGHDLANLKQYQSRLWIVSGILIMFIIYMKWRTIRKKT